MICTNVSYSKYAEKQNIYKHNYEYLEFKYGTDIFSIQKEVQNSDLPIKQENVNISGQLRSQLAQKNWFHKLHVYN